jgi:hypothetical protein
MIITQMHLMLGKIESTLKCAVLSHNTMPQMCQVLSESAISMLTAGMSTSVVPFMLISQHFQVFLSTLSLLQWFFREFGQYVQQASQPQTTCLPCVGERLADVNVVNRVPHGGGGIMV